jgi:glycosyltransferase involved in cell wall biosynthesis
MEPKKPHVVLIAYYYPPSTSIGGMRPYRFSKYLKRLGYTCDVITASEQKAPAPDVILVPDPVGAVLEGRSKDRPTSMGWHVERFIRRFVIPGCMGVSWSMDAARKCQEILTRHPHRKVVVLTTFPPVGTVLAGLLIHSREKVPWIADFRDPMSSGIIARTLHSRALYWLRQMEDRAIRRASAVIANVSGVGELWRSTHPKEAGKIHVIWNGYDTEDRPQAREIPVREKREIVHAGSIYWGRSPLPILQSFARLRERGEPTVADAKISLIGPIVNKYEMDPPLCERAAREGWLNMTDGSVPKAEALRATEEADGLLLLQPDSDLQIPAKLFEYIGIGRPVLALVPPNSAVEYVLKGAEIPNVCIYNNDPPDAVDDKLIRYLELPNQPVGFSAWFETNFEAGRQARQLAEIIEEVGK